MASKKQIKRGIVLLFLAFLFLFLARWSGEERPKRQEQGEGGVVLQQHPGKQVARKTLAPPVEVRVMVEEAGEELEQSFIDLPHRGHQERPSSEKERESYGQERQGSRTGPWVEGSVLTAAMYNVTISNASARFQEIGGFVVFSAFYDDRLQTPFLRLVTLGPLKRHNGLPGLWCLFPFLSKDPAPISFSQTADCRRMKKFCSYLLQCQAPPGIYKASGLSVNTVVVVEGRRDNNYLNQTGKRVRLEVVVNEVPSPERLSSFPPLFGVCLSPLHGKMSVLTLVEMLELQRLLGVVHFTVYTYRITREVSRVLSYYQAIGAARVLAWPVPRGESLWEKGRALAAMDCLLRNMRQLDYVTFSDLQHVAVPREGASWAAMLETVQADAESLPTLVAAYHLQVAPYYPPRRSNYRGGGSGIAKRQDPTVLTSESQQLVTIHSVLRGLCSGNRSVALVRPERVLEVDGGQTVRPVSPLYILYELDTDMALARHYTGRQCWHSQDATTERSACEGLTVDRSLWRLQGALLDRTKYVLHLINSHTSELWL